MTRLESDFQTLHKTKVLIAEDSTTNQIILKDIVEHLGHQPFIFGDGQSALDHIQKEIPDLILLDMVMPKMTGMDVLNQLKYQGLLDKIPVIVISSIDNTEDIATCIRLGAKDYMVKPFNPILLKARIEACIERKKYHEREEHYYQLVEDFNQILEKRVQQQVREISQSHLATIFAMSKLAESRDEDTGEHLERMREYCRVLCLELRKKNKFKYEITDSFIEDIYIASPLHDLGKVAIPDSVLQKPGKLTDAEWHIIKQHTVIGAKTLREVHEKHPFNSFIQLGIEVAECHHEKWDGSGYPYGKKGTNIPLSGRILALADVYDALTSKRCYKAAYSHSDSTKIIFQGNETHFDPDIVEAFYQSERQFQQIKKQFRDPDETA